MGEKEGGEENESQTATDEFETFHASDTDTSEEDSDFDIEQFGRKSSRSKLLSCQIYEHLVNFPMLEENPDKHPCISFCVCFPSENMFLGKCAKNNRESVVLFLDIAHSRCQN